MHSVGSYKVNFLGLGHAFFSSFNLLGTTVHLKFAKYIRFPPPEAAYTITSNTFLAKLVYKDRIEDACAQ